MPWGQKALLLCFRNVRQLGCLRLSGMWAEGCKLKLGSQPVVSYGGYSVIGLWPIRIASASSATSWEWVGSFEPQKVLESTYMVQFQTFGGCALIRLCCQVVRNMNVTKDLKGRNKRGWDFLKAAFWDFENFVNQRFPTDLPLWYKLNISNTEMKEKFMLWLFGLDLH